MEKGVYAYGMGARVRDKGELIMPLISLTDKAFRELEIVYKIIHDTVWKQRQQPLDDFIERMALNGLSLFKENDPLEAKAI